MQTVAVSQKLKLVCDFPTRISILVNYYQSSNLLVYKYLLVLNYQYTNADAVAGAGATISTKLLVYECRYQYEIISIRMQTLSLALELVCDLAGIQIFISTKLLVYECRRCRWRWSSCAISLSAVTYKTHSRLRSRYIYVYIHSCVCVCVCVCACILYTDEEVLSDLYIYNISIYIYYQHILRSTFCWTLPALY